MRKIKTSPCRLFRGLCLCLCLSLALVGCSAPMSWESAQKAMENSIAAGDTARALRIGLDYVADDPDSYSAWWELYYLYRDDLEDDQGANELLQKVYEATGNSSFYNELLGRDETIKGDYQALHEALPLSEEILLDGRPFKEWTPGELWDYFPFSENNYGDEFSEESDWYRSERYKEYGVNLSYYPDNYTPVLSCDFDSLGGYDNAYSEGPEAPTLPRGILPGQSPKEVFMALGAGEALAETLAENNNVTLNQDQNELTLNVYKDDYGDYQYIQVWYNTNDFYGELTFGFEGGKLTDYGMSLMY